MRHAGKTTHALYAALLAGLLATSAASAQPCDPQWALNIGQPGMNSPVNALLVTGPPQTRFVYAGGRMTVAGGASAAKIARWDGTSWSPLGTGIGGVGSVVNALSASAPSLGGGLFAGGQFTSAGGIPVSNIAHWDGKNWSSLAGGVDGPVFAMVVHDDGSGPALFVGGSFTQAGSVEAHNVARWNGAAWSAVGPGTNDRVFAMTIFDDGDGERLCIGGAFTMIGAVSVSRVARWSGLGWSAMGNGFNDAVFSLTTFDDGVNAFGPELYAGGSFTQSGGSPVGRVARWTGTTWQNLGVGTNATVRALAAFDDGAGPALYAGGSFVNAGGVAVNRLARWNGLAWSGVDGGLSDAAFALAVEATASRIGPAVFVGGSFTQAGGDSANYVARWVGCVDLPGDMNDDGRIDAADIAPFMACLTGPDGTVLPGCVEADTDTDDDVDLADFATFAAFFTSS